MMRRITAILVPLGFVVSVAHAVLIGFFPGLENLIRKADAIVILRVDSHVDERRNSTLYATHDCFIYQTLSGDIRAGSTVRLRLMDTRTSFVSPYALHSTHLMFLTKRRSSSEPTDYRTIEIRAANIRLMPFGHEKFPEGKTTVDQITSLLKRTVEYNAKEQEKEQGFLNLMIKGNAEQTDAGDKK